jgi:putative autotransporter adhesin-like protein
MQPLYLKPVLSTNVVNMKKFVIVVLVYLSFSAYAQQTETRNLGPFTGVRAAEGIDVYLKKGDKESAKVEVTGTSIDNVLTEISGSYLKVHMRDGNYRGKVEAKVYVTYVQVNKLSASTAGSIFADGIIKANSMEISAVTAGTVEISVDAGDIEASASSAGDMELKGKAKSFRADASTAGEVDAYDLDAENVDADASTAGSIKVSASKSLEARASTGGSVRYRGNPDKSITDSTSGGSVKKSN